MLSYRHAFHAGNHADVLKHAALLALLDYYSQKDKPWWYVDSHAGAGLYDLHGEYASRNAEYTEGVGRLWSRPDPPPLIGRYLDLVRTLNPDGALHIYPGSPWCAAHCARPDDRLRLFELHPTDQKLLIANFRGSGRQTRIETIDGYAGLKSVLPPLTRRAVVLIDPSYELKSDYQHTAEAVQDALGRFAQGTYVIWYPQLQRPEPRQLVQALRKLEPASWLQVSLTVKTPAEDGFGMHGSGLFILNPPWTLPAQLGATLPWLVAALGQDKGAGYALDHRIP